MLRDKFVTFYIFRYGEAIDQSITSLIHTYFLWTSIFVILLRLAMR